MAGRKILDEAEARRCLAKATASGLGLSAWARREGLDGRSLNTWRLNLARRESAPAVQRLVELIPVDAASAVPTGYRVRCGRFIVEVGDDFDAGTLGRLLRTVAAC